MIFGMVQGTVVSSVKADGMDGAKYLLTERCDEQGAGKKDFLVVLDLLGAGPGELVLISQGSACRQTEITDDKPIDAMVVGIVDLVDKNNSLSFRK